MLSDRFDDALTFARRIHNTQRRKASGTPYIAHLLSVCALVLEYGGTEDQAIAGLLHDAVEDQGGTKMAQEIEARFGATVARIVQDCSDSDGDTKADWQIRKDSYIAGIAGKSDDAALVIACDKLHNATSILVDLQMQGPDVFDRFTAGREGTLWYYRQIADHLSQRLPGPLTRRLDETVARIERLA